MSTDEPLDRTTAIVTGASRGFGLAVSSALCNAGARVVGVARTAEDLHHVRRTLGENFIPVDGDATDQRLARDLIAEYRPRTLVLCAGAVPGMAALPDHTWESFSKNWYVDVRHTFEWVTEALRSPLPTGSLVIALSSGAALKGSPLSGGYAGAKSAIRFIASYAAMESKRNGLGIGFVSLLPQLTPATDLGATAVAAYAAAQGVDVETFVDSMGPVVTPELAGRSVLELSEGKISGREQAAGGGDHGAYALDAKGLRGLD